MHASSRQCIQITNYEWKTENLNLVSYSFTSWLSLDIFRFGFSFSPEIVRVRAELTKQRNSCRVVNFGIILDIKKKEDEKERNNQCGETNTMKTQQ